MHNKEEGGHLPSKYCQTSCFGGSIQFNNISILKHDFHQSFIPKRRKKCL